MSVRVNLLRADEIQQQTAVSQDFLRRGGTLLGVGVASLGIVFVGLQYFQARSSHLRLKGQWAAIESDFLAVKETSDQHAANMKYVGELEAWSQSRVEWEAPLTALQRLAPENLQFIELEIGSEVVISKKEPRTKEYVGTPARAFNFSIAGRAVGDMSDQDVIAFVETIRESPEFGPWLKWVRLQGMQRESANREAPAEEARNFRINGAAMERMMK